ncbi:zinc-finger homeodomain protein 10-like [Salvia splendens]|nr:zinc-finger homeodomain protein 10-like [Salvia splendens]
MPVPATDPALPTSLKCAACNCLRNFHRRDPEDPPSHAPPPAAMPAIEFQPHQPPPPRSGSSPYNSPSPPPICSSYHPSAPHMLLALSHGLSAPPSDVSHNHTSPISGGGGNLRSGSRKRYRTKFTQFQKEKMLEFAEKADWKMHKRDEGATNSFCGEIGVDKGVFKVWMHNNKNTFGKKDNINPPLPLMPHLSNAEISTPFPAAAIGMSYSDMNEDQLNSFNWGYDPCVLYFK